MTTPSSCTWRLNVGALRVDVDPADNTVTVLWEDKAVAMVAIPAMGATGEDADTWTQPTMGLLAAGPFEALLTGFPDGVNFERLCVLPLPTFTYADPATGATVRLHLDERPPVAANDLAAAADLAYRTEDDRYGLLRVAGGRWMAWDYQDPERPGQGDTMGASMDSLEQAAAYLAGFYAPA